MSTTQRRTTLSFTGALLPLEEIKDPDPVAHKRILSIFDAVIHSEQRFKHIERTSKLFIPPQYLDMLPDKINHRIRTLKRDLLHMIKRRTWNTYNELADFLSKEKENDLVYALFKRLCDVALGEVEDKADGSKHILMLINTLMDEKKQLSAHPGFKPKLATLTDINKASELVLELLMENGITMEVAARFHKLLESRLSILQQTMIQPQLEEMREHLKKINSNSTISQLHTNLDAIKNKITP